MKKSLQLPDVIKIIADESVDFRIIQGLRNANMEVIAICEINPAITDKEVLQISVQHQTLLLTEDKDFGELVFRFQLAHCGILLIRISEVNIKIETVINTIRSHFGEMISKFSVLTKEKLRISDF